MPDNAATNDQATNSIDLGNFTQWLQQFMTSPQAQAANATSREQALRAIWNNRPDIQNLYYENWGADVDPIKAMEDWLRNTSEQIPDPVQYAQERGWLSQGQVYGGWQWAQLALQAAIAAADQTFQWARQQGLDEQAAQQLAQQQAQLELQRQLATGYINGQPTTEQQQIWNQYLYNMGALGIQQQAQNLANQQAYWNTFGYQGNTPTFEREQWQTGQTGYYNGMPTMQREAMQNDAALAYLNLLSQQQGPGDWIRYWNTIRGAQNTNMPAWVTALQQGYNLPAWQAPYGQGGLPYGQNGTYNPYTMPVQEPGHISPPNFAQVGTAPNSMQPSPGAMLPNGGYGGIYPGSTQGWGNYNPYTMMIPTPGVVGQNLPGETQAEAEQRIYGTTPNTMQPSPGHAQQQGQNAQTAIYTPPNTSNWQQGNWADILGVTPAGNMPTYGGQQQNYNPSAWQRAIQSLSPMQITPTMWNNLLPSEQQGLYGAINSSGGWADDWLRQMQNAWPTGGNVNATSWWR